MFLRHNHSRWPNFLRCPTVLHKISKFYLLHRHYFAGVTAAMPRSRSAVDRWTPGTHTGGDFANSSTTASLSLTHTHSLKSKSLEGGSIFDVFAVSLLSNRLQTFIFLYDSSNAYTQSSTNLSIYRTYNYKLSTRAFHVY